MRFLIFVLLISSFDTFAQCVSVDLALKDNACTNENLVVSTTTVASQYAWDFCTGDLRQTPVATEVLTNSNFFRARSLRIIQVDGLWYGFAISATANILMRLDFGSSPDNTPSFTSLGNVSGALSSAFSFDVIQVNNVWHLFVANGGAKNILRLSFDNGIAQPPTVTTLSTPTVFDVAGPNAIELVADQGNYYAFVPIGTSVATSKIVRLALGTNIQNNSPAVTEFTVSSGNQLRGISIMKECGQWIGLVISFSTNAVHRMNFGTDLSATPAISLVNTGGILNQPVSLEIRNDGGRYFAFVQNARTEEANAALIRLDFGYSIAGNVPTTSKLSFAQLTGGGYALEMTSVGSTWYAYTFNLTAQKLIKFSFPNNCPVNTTTSDKKSPSLVKYSAAGKYYVMLRTSDVNGNASYKVDSVVVSATPAPDISFSVDNLCVNADVVFNPVNSSNDLTGFLWSFGDGNQSTDDVAVHQFGTTGDFRISLEVTASNLCKNTHVDTLTIFGQPQPLFELPAVSTFCTNQAYTFTNTSTVDSGYPVTWEWLVNGVSQASTEDFEFAFTQTTSQTVTLKASIPGCEETYEEIIGTLAEGPFVDFTVNGRCEESVVTFTNNSSGVINSFTWNFDDGTPTSPDVDVNHIFTEPGTYDVTLSASTPSGCLNSSVETITIYSKPVVSFSVQAPPFSCSGSSTMFVNNTANPTDSNIATWLWDFDDPASGANNTSSVKTPQHVYATAGDYDVSLTATTNFGCQSVQVSPITIAQTPTATFSNDPTCEDVNVTFRDETGGTSSWDWQIGSSFYTTQNPVHQFTNPGNYTVSLTVTASNGCLASTSRQVNVPMKISPDFTFIKNCVNENTTFTDVTNDAADAIVQRRWTINGSPLIEADPVTTVTFPNVGVYAASLVTVTQSGCISAPVNKNVSVSNKPQASFTATPESGGAPLIVQFDNNSVGAVSYLWSFGDAENTVTNDVNPEFTFVEEGEYEVALTATSIQQCTHTFSRIIRAEATLINLVLSQLNLLPTTLGGVRPEVTIVNESNVSLGDIELIMDISGESQLRQIITGPLLPGASQVFTFPVEIADRDGIRYVCVSTLREGETETGDNRICEDVSDRPLIIPPYPNPANQFLEVEWISSRAGTTRMSLATALGATVLSVNVPVEEGYSHYSLDVREVPAGMYVLSVQQGSLRKSFRVVIAH